MARLSAFTRPRSHHLFHIQIAILNRLVKRVKLAIDMIQELQIIRHCRRHVLRLPILLQVGKLILLSHALVQVLYFDFLNVTIFALTTHLLLAFLFDLCKFSKSPLFILLLLTLFHLMRGCVNVTNSVHSE